MATARGHRDGASSAARACAAKHARQVHKHLLEHFIRSAISRYAEKHVGATLPFLSKVDGDEGWVQHDWSLADIAVDRWPISCSLVGLSSGESIVADEALKPDQCPFPMQNDKRKYPKGLQIKCDERFSVKLKEILVNSVDECTRRGGGIGHKEGKCACIRCAAAARSLQYVGTSVMRCASCMCTEPAGGGEDASLAGMVHEFLGAVATMHTSGDGIVDLSRLPTFVAGSHSWKPTAACRVTVCTACTIADQPAVGCGHGPALVCAKCARFNPHTRCCPKCNGLFEPLGPGIGTILTLVHGSKVPATARGVEGESVSPTSCRCRWMCKCVPCCDFGVHRVLHGSNVWI